MLTTQGARRRLRVLDVVARVVTGNGVGFNPEGGMEMRRFLTLVAGFVLALAMAAPAMAHPAVPEQSTCVMNANAANGAHTAAANVDGVAAHVLFVKSPHFCK